jgi:hypothetical protein
MGNATLEITDTFDSTKRNLLLVGNGDSPETHSIAVASLNSLVPKSYDYISLSYTGSNLTGVVFKIGGSGGTTVATLVLAYDGSNNLQTVTKT